MNLPVSILYFGYDFNNKYVNQRQTILLTYLPAYLPRTEVFFLNLKIVKATKLGQ